MAIELFCEECGNELETHVLNRKVTVDPCGKCADESRDQGYEDGCDSRDDEVDSLQERLDELKTELESLQEQLKEATTERHPINGPNS